MNMLFRNLSGSLYLLVSLAVLLIVLLSPIFAVLIGIEYFSGSGGALNAHCEVTTIQSRAIAFAAPKKFWTEQVQYLDAQIDGIVAAPERMRAEQQEVLRRLAEATAQLKREQPELFVDRRTPAQQSAEALRTKAYQIENAELLREVEAQRLQRLAQVQRCRNVAAARLRAL